MGDDPEFYPQRFNLRRRGWRLTEAGLEEVPWLGLPTVHMAVGFVDVRLYGDHAVVLTCNGALRLDGRTDGWQDLARRVADRVTPGRRPSGDLISADEVERWLKLEPGETLRVSYQSGTAGLDTCFNILLVASASLLTIASLALGSGVLTLMGGLLLAAGLASLAWHARWTARALVVDRHGLHFPQGRKRVTVPWSQIESLDYFGGAKVVTDTGFHRLPTQGGDAVRLLDALEILMASRFTGREMEAGSVAPDGALSRMTGDETPSNGRGISRVTGEATHDG